MLKAAALVVILGLIVARFCTTAVSAAPPCPECGPDKVESVREAIRAERARDDIRRAKEPTDRPWDHKDFGRNQRPDTPPVVDIR